MSGKSDTQTQKTGDLLAAESDDSGGEHLTIEPEADGSDNAPASPKPARTGRDYLTIVLLLIFLILLANSMVAVWARNQIFDSDRFVSTVAPLANNPDIQIAVSQRTADQINAAIDEQRGDDPTFDGVAGAVVLQGVHRAVEVITTTIVESPQFEKLWADMARAGHRALVVSLQGGDSNLLIAENGEIAFDLNPLLEEVSNRLAAQGLSQITGERLQNIDLTFVIFSSDDLATAQTATKWLDNLATYLPILALAALVGYFLASRNRWRAGIHASFGVGITMIALLLMLVIARWWYLRQLDPDIDQNAAKAFLDTLTTYLRRAIRLLALAGFVVAAILAIAKPGDSPLSIRERLELRNKSLVERWPAFGEGESTVASHRSTAIAVFLGAVGMVVLIWDQLSLGGALVLGIIMLIGLLILGKINPPSSLSPE